MPPPTSLDPWLASRRFGIVIDAGSSGSRLQIYSWIDARTLRERGGRLDILPKVEKGTREADQWVAKVEPGLASFADDLEAIGPYLKPLLSHAMQHVTPSLQVETPIFVLATAGMRLLSQKKQNNILKATCDFFRFHSRFRVSDNNSKRGPCGSHVRVISGEEEGLFGWIAVNYLMDGFRESQERDVEASTYGFLDMGGASTQIAFEPSKAIRSSSREDLHDVRLRLLRGDEITHNVFVTTWLGYGTNQARERYVGETINSYELGGVHEHEKLDGDVIPDPCLPRNLRREETPVPTVDSTSHTRKPHVMLGTGSFEICLKQTLPLLNKTVTCHREPCLFNGVHVPPIDFSVAKFIGVSEYWYSSENVFGLGGAYNFPEYERAASTFCSSDWNHLVEQHMDSKKKGHLGGDGEVVDVNGNVTAVGQWGYEVELSRLQMQCFKAAWIVNVLHEGIGLPRTVDPGGNITTESKAPQQKAAQKGLDAATFQSLDNIDDTAISWTLGKMVLEASKEVPPLSATLPQLPDPMEVEETGEEPQPNLIETAPHWSDHLRPHKSGLPLHWLLSVYILIFLVVAFCVYTFRHRLRSRWRRFIRKTRREEIAMEEGKMRYLNGNGWHSPGSGGRHSHDTVNSKGTLLFASPIRRVSSLRSFSGPKSPYRSGSPPPEPSPKNASFPIPPNHLPIGHGESSYDFSESQSLTPSHPLYGLSLSRNSSQVSLVPRQASSRSGSGALTPKRVEFEVG